MTGILKFLKILFFVSVFFSVGSVFAVPPPDFIIQVASQLVSFFTIGIAILSGVYITLYQFIRGYILKYRKYCISGGIISIIIFAGVGSYFADRWYRDHQLIEINKQWLEQSKLHMEDTTLSKTQPLQDIPIVSMGSSSDLTHIGGKNPSLMSGSIAGNTGEIFGSISQENDSLFITNRELQSLLKAKNTPFILDTREDIEYAIGNMPGSRHIRFADLKSAGGAGLPKNQTIYVLCWSGMRGKEVVLFLRSKGFQARYLENGVDDWVSQGGLWKGEVKFSHAYPETRYSQVFHTDEILQRQKIGTVLVDVRSKEKFEKNYISGAINIPLLDTPTPILESLFLQISAKKEVITVCDEYINCFGAKLVGIELEKRGAIFLGRYNTPWKIQ